MPSARTVHHWIEQDEIFRQQYARACELRTDYWAEEIIEIADDGSNDWMEREKRDGTVEAILNKEHVQRSSLRIEARKWLMARIAPRKWGVASRGDGGGDNENGPPDIGNVPPGVPI